MRIDSYEPDKSFFLSHPSNESLPKSYSWVSIIVLIIGIFLFWMFSILAFPKVITVGVGIFVAFIVVAVFLGLRPRKFVLVVDISRNTNSCLVAVRQRNKKIKEYKVSLDKVRNITFKHTRKKFTEGDILGEKGTKIPIEMTIVADLDKETIIDGTMEIDGLDLRDELLDFSKRFAQVCDMSCGHIVRNDPQICEVKFFQKNMDHLDNEVNINDVSEHSHLEDAYKANNIKKDKIMDKIICEEWDNQKHRITAELVEYNPKSKLILEYKRSKIARFFLYLVCYIIGSCVAAALGRALIGATMEKVIEQEKFIKQMLFLLQIAAGTGVVLAMAHYCYRMASGYFHVVQWNFNLKDKKLKITKGFQETSVDLVNIEKIVLYRVKTIHTRSTGSGNNRRTETYHCYNGVVALSSAAMGEFFVGETGRLNENPDGAYSEGLVYANIFIKSLDVPFIFREKRGEIHEEEYYYSALLKQNIS